MVTFSTHTGVIVNDPRRTDHLRDGDFSKSKVALRPCCSCVSLSDAAVVAGLRVPEDNQGRFSGRC